MADTFNLVTDASTLAAGDEIIIVSTDGTKAISTTQNNNNRGVADVTESADAITPGETVQIIVLEASDANWKLKVGNDAYLYAASNSSNHLKTANSTTAGNNGVWEITIGQNAVASIVAQGSNSRNVMQYNASSALFSCYASASQTAIKIYKKSTAPAPAVAKPAIAGETSFFESTQVTITCDTQGATIYYTLDGTDPTAESTEFTADITLTETKTVKAIAIKGSDASEISTKVFTKNPSFASFEALIAAELAEHTLVEVSFSNVVIDSIYLNSSKKRYGIYFTVNDVAYEIYCNKAEIPAAWEAGDKVSGTIRGDWYSYNGLWEIVPSASDWAWTSLTRTADTRMAGTYNIGGENADYATLSAAATDLRAKGLKGDVTLLICADIAEVANVGLVNETDYTITVAPNAAAKRTISFGTVPDNVGPSGHIMIGYDMAAWASTDTKNVVIDGSFEGEGQYLEIEGGTIGGVEVVYYGYVTNSVVKNCRIISPRTSNTTYVVHFRSENGSDKAPTGVGFENCYMQVTGVANAQAVYFNGSQSATAAGKPKDCYLKDCEIVSNLRGIFFNGAINATFEGNTFRLPNASGGYIAHAIMGNAQKGTIIVRGNKFIENGSTNANAGSYGLQAITASGGSDVWVIENNYFAGMDSKAATEGKSVVLAYIRCGDSCVVRHNTFYMPSLTHKPGTDLVAAQAISCVWLAGSSKYPVENNIFVSDETVANNSLIRGALNENVKDNVFYHAGGNAAILAGAVVAADSTAFFAEGANAGSKWKLPVFANAATGDLSITTADADLLMPRLADVLVDIEGEDRGENTYAGAFEGPEVSPATAIDAVKVEGIQKIFRNGEVLIIRDGKTYNMMGQIVR